MQSKELNTAKQLYEKLDEAIYSVDNSERDQAIFLTMYEVKRLIDLLEIQEGEPSKHIKEITKSLKRQTKQILDEIYEEL